MYVFICYLMQKDVLCCIQSYNFFNLGGYKVRYVNVVYYRIFRTLYRKICICISRSLKRQEIKMFINYKREMYALAHLNL